MAAEKLGICEPGLSRRTKIARVIFIAFFVSMFCVAVTIHVSSTLPVAYSWLRTLELFRDAILDSYFIVFAMIAVLAGVSSRAGSRGRVWLQELVIRPSRKAIVVAMLGLVAALIFPDAHSYVIADLVLLPVFLFLITGFLEDRKFAPAALNIVVGVIGLVVVSYAFTIIKSQLFVVRQPNDDSIIALEAAIFGLPLYQSIADWSSEFPFVVHLSDWVYFLFFHHIALVALFLFVRADRYEEIRYFVSLSACYMIGVLSYYLYPTLGPVFFDRERFAYLETLVAFTSMIQEMLRYGTASAANGNLKMIDTYAFIAGMPSLHMAHETVMLYFSRRSSLMLVLSSLFWGFSLLAVLVLGWHYLFEAIAGVALGVMLLPLAIIVSGREGNSDIGAPSVGVRLW